MSLEWQRPRVSPSQKVAALRVVEFLDCLRNIFARGFLSNTDFKYLLAVNSESFIKVINLKIVCYAAFESSKF